MKYKFKYQVGAFEFWQLSMDSTYGSMVGVCNIIFTVAMILLTAKFWEQVNIIVKGLLIVMSCLFIIIQPVGVYLRAKKQAALIPQDMEISFDDKGIYVKTQKKSSNVKWKEVKGIIKKSNMIIIFSTEKYGFVLTNRMLDSQKEAFYKYIMSKVNI